MEDKKKQKDALVLWSNKGGARCAITRRGRCRRRSCDALATDSIIYEIHDTQQEEQTMRISGLREAPCLQSLTANSLQS